MIKVGQIYYSRVLYGKIVVTFKRADGTEFHAVRDDGYFFIGRCDEIDRNYDELIAEYPTWQEAVNSEYFKKKTDLLER